MSYTIRQQGPGHSYDTLARLVPTIRYKPEWTFELAEISRGQGCGGLTLMIGAQVRNSVGTDTISILHLMPVPAAAYDVETWKRWILDQVLLVERHEAMEFFQIDGERPFFPEHGPGRDPYAIALTKTPERVATPATPWVGGSTEFVCG